MKFLHLIVITVFVLVSKAYTYHHHDDYNMHPTNMPTSSKKITGRQLSYDSAINTAQYWIDNAQNTVQNILNKKINNGVARNVIFFIGDGMSIATLTASRIYQGQLNGRFGEDDELSFEKFPYTGLVKTYCANSQVADSACSATSYLCGVKGPIFTVGVTGNVQYGNCTDSVKRENQVDSILAWAQKSGKFTGLVTTTTITHATPSASYGHVANRVWENDADVTLDGWNPKTCPDLAAQLVKQYPGKDINVIFGGGRSNFLPTSVVDSDGVPGERLDNQNLINLWKSIHPQGEFVTNKQEFLSVDYTNASHIMGLFTPRHLTYNLISDKSKEPTLTEMTENAIKFLSQRGKNEGYMLFIEGGRIDHAHHDTLAHYALDETLELSRAVQKAVDITDQKDTLIVVSSDHSHTMSLAGYSERGQSILGVNSYISDIDNLPYATLSYANGPQRHLDETGNREDLTDKFHKDFQYPAAVPLARETHSGEDVGIFAIGPQSHLFTGLFEQNVVPHLIAYAACFGDGKTACK